MHHVHHPDVQILLEVVRPVSVLILDPEPAGLLERMAATGCRATHLSMVDFGYLSSLERYDLGVVANTLEQLERRTAGMLLARLRDLLTRRFVVLVPLGAGWEGQVSHWELADLLGYGLNLLARYQVDGRPLGLFHYAIESYKTTPEWFNSRHWAHPERWKP